MLDEIFSFLYVILILFFVEQPCLHLLVIIQFEFTQFFPSRINLFLVIVLVLVRDHLPSVSFRILISWKTGDAHRRLVQHRLKHLGVDVDRVVLDDDDLFIPPLLFDRNKWVRFMRLRVKLHFQILQRNGIQNDHHALQFQIGID